LEYYRPLRRGAYTFLSSRLFYEDDNLNVYERSVRAAVYGKRALGTSFDLGINTSRQSELRFGYQIRYEQSFIRTGSPVLPSFSGDVSAASLRWAFDGQDSPLIPTR